MGPVIINSAVDSLYCSFDSGNLEGVDSYLEFKQEEAKQEKSPVPIEIDGQKLLIQAYGSKGYSYHLLHEHYLLKVVSTVEKMPDLYFQVYAASLYELGHQLVWKKIAEMANSLGVSMEPKISRIDLCVDFQGWKPTPRRMKDFVTQARKRRLYLEVDEATGYQFGVSGPVLARIYNKTEEIEVSKKQWMKEVWKQNPNCDESKEVWRLEFQFRIKALKQFGALTVEDTFERLHGIYEYGMGWLSLRKSAEGRKERSPVDRNWRALMGAKFPGVSCERIPEAKKQAEERVLIRGAAGYLTSYGALRQITDCNHVMMLLSKDLNGYFAHKETTFEGMVRKKIAQDPGNK